MAVATPERNTEETAYERNLRTSREAKQRRRGVCESCGAETRYNGSTVNGPSRLCLLCAARENAAKRVAAGPFQARLYAALDGGVDRFTDLYLLLGCTNNHLATALDRELKAGRVVRVARGRYALPEQP